MIIRDAVDADLPQIVEIVNSFLFTTTTEYGEVAGFSCYGDFRDSQKWPGYRFVVEHTIHVRESQWGTGVGRALMEALVERAAAAGKRVMVAAVDAENVGSIRFHERCGFVEVARMPDIGFKLGRWLTLVLLQRRVDATGSRPIT